MMDQVPTSEIEKSGLKIVDDFSPLIKIYDKSPEDREKVIREYFKDSNRISFGEIDLDDYVNLVQEHFTTHTQKYLEDERSFLMRFRDINLEAFVENPILKSKSLFPEGLISPTTVFLLNGNDTDGKVIGDVEFGINLNNFFRTYYDGTQREIDFETLLKDIQGTISHESVHCFCNQLEWRKEEYSKGLIETAFEEGLATVVQEIHHSKHDRYIDEFTFWKEIITKAVFENGHEKYFQILKSIRDNKNLKEFNPKAVSLIEKRFSERGEITQKEFDFLITKSVIKLNGPIYHIGFQIWTEVYEKEGIEGVKGRIVKGPKSFEEFFK